MCMITLNEYILWINQTMFFCNPPIKFIPYAPCIGFSDEHTYYVKCCIVWYFIQRYNIDTH